MEVLTYIKDKKKRQTWLRAFHIWQLRPHEVDPLSEETHVCASCKTVFTGNYCPRCGQSAGVERFSFRKAIMLFLDVWGIGNRSMLRSLRDLMLRPGYMIRDYLRGMQSAYFPPFKMFFILTAFSLLVEHGFDFGLSETEKPAQAEQVTTSDTLVSASIRPTADKENVEKDEPPMYYFGLKFAKTMNKLREKNPAIFALISLMIFSLPLFLFLRRSPNIPDMRYSEFAVALVYTSNSYSIYSIIGNLLNSGIIKFIAVLMIFVALKQFSGYSKLRLLRYITLAILIIVAVVWAVAVVGIYIAYVITR